MPCSPGPGRKGSGRSTSEAWSRPRSPTATAGPVTRICTPTSRWRTRCRPSTDAGCRSTAGCCSRPTWPRRRPTTPRWSSTSATRWGCGSRNGPAPTRRSGRSGRSSVSTPRLNQRWSTRRVLIKARQGELAIQFQRDHGRPPTPVEALQLAQQATLETRDAKHEPRTLAEQRATWHAQAAETLGGPDAVQAMISTRSIRSPRQAPMVDAEWVAETAEKVLAVVEERRSTWQSWHVRAEAQRQVRAVQFPSTRSSSWWTCSSTEVLQTRSISLARPDDGISEPEALRRVDGSSVYTVAGSELFTSHPDPGRRAAPRRGRGPHATAGSWTSARWSWPCWNRRERQRPGCGAGGSGSFHVHLRGAAAAGDRTSRRRENHRHAHPRSGVDATAAAR